MSAAANAAGYLYAHGQLARSDFDAQGSAEHSQRTAKSLSQGESAALKLVRTPKVEYRKRRFYAVPSAA